jgi:hypothetical protein
MVRLGLGGINPENSDLADGFQALEKALNA